MAGKKKGFSSDAQRKAVMAIYKKMHKRTEKPFDAFPIELLPEFTDKQGKIARKHYKEHVHFADKKLWRAWDRDPRYKKLEKQGKYLFDGDALRKYMKAMDTGDYDPVPVYHDGEAWKLADGTHRTTAAVLKGKKTIKATLWKE